MGVQADGETAIQTTDARWAGVRRDRCSVKQRGQGLEARPPGPRGHAPKLDMKTLDNRPEICKSSPSTLSGWAAAKRLGVPDHVIDGLVRAGLVRAFRVGVRWEVQLEDVARLEEASIAPDGDHCAAPACKTRIRSVGKVACQSSNHRGREGLA